MVNIPRALFSGRTGREPRYHVAIEELQEWAYTGNRLIPLRGYPDDRILNPPARQPCAEAGSIYVITSFVTDNMRPSGG